MLDADLRVKSANKSYYETFQAFEDSTVGGLLYDIGNGKWDIPMLRRELKDLLPDRKAVKDFQVELEIAGLGKRTMLLNARQIERQKDQTPLILLSIEDVTESRGMLLRLNEDLKHIAYATSHDLQEPLRMVVSYSQLLARECQGKLDPKAEQYIGYAVEGATRMERLLRNLREYWSVTENWDDALVAVDCNIACDKAIQLLDGAIQESGAKIIREPLPDIMSTELSIVLLFQNLISNAIKYRREQVPPIIHITAEKQEGAWRFCVADNGIGIEAQHLDMIFAPFKRLHGSGQYPGSGLGLAICKKIVERSGGRIWAESSGTGSMFWFTLSGKGGNE